MRKFATVRKIEKITPIIGADRIEMVHTGGWHCAAGKGDFKEGDLTMFFEVDAALPVEPRYEFLRARAYKHWENKAGDLIDECFRIRAIKCKKEVSQGLFMPLSEFPEVEPVEGADYTELLHIRHYDEVAEEAEIKLGKVVVNTEARGTFPADLVAKTDEERLYNLPEYFDTMKDVEFEATEKNDGSSCTMLYAPGKYDTDPFLVCSRNLSLKRNDQNVMWRLAVMYDVEAKLKKYHELTGDELAVQGEAVGVGLNNNRDQYTDNQWHVFRIRNITQHRWFTPEERYNFCAAYYIPHVKVLKEHWKSFKDLKTMEDFEKYTNGLTDRGHEREGVVWKSYDGIISFKVINPDYLVKEKE